MSIAATVIADTVNPYGARITTFQVTAPRFLLAEVNTHRVIAKSAASSRAIPVQTRIHMVENEPFVPIAFGKNQRGMQAELDLDGAAAEAARDIWLEAAKAAAGYAKELSDLEVHKQHANRLLEPFVYYTGVMTSTEWDNFFWLRTHPDAQPEFRQLAKLMQHVYKESCPEEREYHLPYTDTQECIGLSVVALKSISAARCARVSYKTFDGKASDYGKDLELCMNLKDGGHLSPFDHPAITDTATRHNELSGFTPYYTWDNPSDHRHNWGWIPTRVGVEKDLGLNCARDSHRVFYPYS